MIKFGALVAKISHKVVAFLSWSAEIFDSSVLADFTYFKQRDFWICQKQTKARRTRQP